MNKTEHYQLNQWELHDRVMMQDFNSDNAKIDAALKAEADARAAADTAETAARQTAVASAEGKIALVKLVDMTTAADAIQVDIDLSKLDLNQYHELQLFIAPAAHSTATYIMLRCNGASSGYYHTSTANRFLCRFSMISGASRAGYQMATLYLGNCVGCYPHSSTTGDAYGSTNFSTSDSDVIYGWMQKASTLQKLNLVVDGNGTIGAGTAVWLYGLKK